MEANKILQANLLDIIFEGRNKMYGAYELRKTYGTRLKYSLLAMGAVCLVFTTGILLASSLKKPVADLIVSPDFYLENVPDQQKKQEVVELPKPKVIPQRTLAVTTPLILKDILVKETEVPPTDDIENVQIAAITQDGKEGEIVNAPVEKQGTGGNIELPTKEKEPLPFTTIQTEAKFPGGLDAWTKYLERNLNTAAPVDNGAPPGSYSVVVSFLVDKNGNVSDVQALNDPGYGTAEEAVRVIKKSKQWIPALQNGSNVTYRQKQSITFIVNEG